MKFLFTKKLFYLILSIIFLCGPIIQTDSFARVDSGNGSTPSLGGHDLSILPQYQKRKSGPRKIKKEKDGSLRATWGILSEFNIKTGIKGINIRKILDKKVIINGYMIPLDYDSQLISEFLLVPYMPTCAHIPPPPANMIIKVKNKNGKKLKALYFPVSVKGKLRLINKPVGKDPYMLNGVYEIHDAVVGSVNYE